MVWGIGSQDSTDSLQAFRERYGITFPILHDPGGAVHANYLQQMAFPSAAYPQDWVIGTDGTIIYSNNGFELDAILTAVEGELD